MLPRRFLLFPRRTEPRERLARDVYVLGLIAFFVMVGFGVVLPVLPVYVRSFGVGYLEVGAVVSAFAVMRLAVTPFCGPLIDRVGERTILALGIGIVAASSALTGIANSFVEVLLLRGAGGIGSAMFTVSATTLLLGAVPASQRGRSMGIYQGGFLIGGMAGPAVGGLLSVISLRAPFFFYAGTLVVAGVVGLVLLQPAAARGTATQPAPIALRVVLRDVRFRAACLANFAQGWATMGVRMALIPVLVVELLQETATWTGVAFAIAAVAQTIALAPAGRIVDTIGRRPAIIGSFAVAAAAFMAVPFVTSPWMLIVLLCLYGVASAFMGTAPAASVGDAAGGRSGKPVAIFSAFSDVGTIIGPLAAGALLDAFSYPVAFGSAAALLLLAAIYAVRMPVEVPAAARPPSAAAPEG